MQSSELPLAAVFAEQCLQRLEATCVELTTRQRIADCAVGFVLVPAITEAAFAAQSAQLAETFFHFFTRQVRQTKGL